MMGICRGPTESIVGAISRLLRLARFRIAFSSHGVDHPYMRRMCDWDANWSCVDVSKLG